MPFVEKITRQLPEFQGSNCLLRIPFAIIFIQQGLSKMPVTAADAEVYNLPMSIWFFVAWGELFAGIGLLVGGLTIALKDGVGDMLTRFSGIVICGIMTGVILIGEPESIMYVILYEHLHLMLYCGGLFFALRGNRVK